MHFAALNNQPGRSDVQSLARDYMILRKVSYGIASQIEEGPSLMCGKLRDREQGHAV